MWKPALFLALTALLTNTVQAYEFDGEYVRTKEFYKEHKECVEWDVAVDKPGDRHGLPLMIPECMKWKPQEQEDNVYDLEVVKCKHGCLKWEVYVDGRTVKPVCGKVQKMKIRNDDNNNNVQHAQLNKSRDVDVDTSENTYELPEGKVVGREKLHKQDHECIEWKIHAVKKGGGHTRPTIAPECAHWEWMGSYDFFYDLVVVKVVEGCQEWRANDNGGTVTPYCAVGTGQDRKLDLLKRDKAAKPKAGIAATGPPRGLLKEVQTTIHDLQSQLAQVQHKHTAHMAQVQHGLDDVSGKGKKKANSEELDYGTLQKMQETVRGMQSQIAKARHSLHGTFSKRDAEPKKKTSGVDQGVLQDLQRSVHKFQSQLAKARHTLHAQTSKKGMAAKKMMASGFDQGVLQDMQRTAKKLQTQLAAARHTLHASISQREVEAGDGEEGVKLEAEV